MADVKLSFSRDTMLSPMQAADAAYDGRFITGVLSTGIYCLPSCRARKPLPHNVEFFDSPTIAQAAGLRPCLRCRPDAFYADVYLEGSGKLIAMGWASVTDRKPYRHRFPLSIIQYALWLYHRFSLSQRDVQELLQERGIQVSHETLRRWNIKFAPLLTEELRHREPRRGSRWFLDEVCIEIGGKKRWLWRAVDDSGAVLDLLLQDRRDTQAATTFLGRLLANYSVPVVIHTDKLWSYGAAIRALPVLHGVEHVQVISTARCNNLIEQFHRPTRKQERSGQASSWALFCPRSQLGFKKPRRAQEFLALHTRLSNLHQHT